MVGRIKRQRSPVTASRHQKGPGAPTTEESCSASPNLAGNDSNHGDRSGAGAIASTLVPGNNNVEQQQKSPADKPRKRQHAAILTATSAAPNKSAALIFPPTIFTNAIYSAGIRIGAGAAADSAASADEEVQTQTQTQALLVPPPNYMERDTGRLATNLSKKEMECYHYQKLPPRAPSLSQTERKLWSHHVAAKHAAQRHFPAETCRLLGVITRTVTEKCRSDDEEVKVNKKVNIEPPVVNNHDRKNKKSKRSNKKTKLVVPGGKVEKVEKKIEVKRKAPAFSKAQAMQEAKGDAARNGAELTDGKLEVEAAQNKIDWANALKRGAVRPGWDVNGELNAETVNDPDYFLCSRLLELLKSNRLSDNHAGQRKSLYNGLRSIPTDTVTVLTSLLQLCSPVGFYEIPLIVPYPVLQLVSTVPIDDDDSSCMVTRTYQLQIGVYCNRLLFEIMTEADLHIVMSALDEGSYRITEPIHLPPTAKEPAFCSSPYPTVVFDDEEDDSDDSHNNDDDRNNDSTDKDDVHMMQSTRDDSTVSAFTPRGLLKLLESEGNDISNWPDIAKIIEPSLQVNLMLHQIHGVCWMVQMEHLEGFGINSLVWEEREFADGGKWYYSPAVGQARLSLGGKLGKPPVMKGGILSDEMGLGKTIEVLALILASLDELKEEAASKPKESNHKHATLIVVPPALVSQWLSEIAKVTGDSLVYEFFDCSTLTSYCKSTKQGPADIVVTTYNALEKKGPAKILKSFSWGRVVLDEMQEIRSSTTLIAKNCEELQCERRWMLSGTPLYEGVDDFRGELCFLRLEPFAGNLDDGFFDFAVKNHWQERSPHGLDTLRVLSLLMLRRSKSMTIRSSNLPLLGLKPMNIVFEPVPQDRSERALYCFLEFLVHETITHEGKGDETKNKTFLRLLRELCVSPALLNGGLSCSSQLQTLNRLMIDHNRREYGESAIQQTDDGDSDNGNEGQDDCMSCDEAIRFLSQVQDAARVDEAFETSMTLGGGGGISRRNRATESVDQQFKEAQEKVARATRECETARSKRAKARWHLALEQITTGKLAFQNYADITPTILRLWRWRFMVTRSGGNTSRILPQMLTRGWRPSEIFFDTASSKRAKANWQRVLEKVTQGDIYVPSKEGASKSTKSVLASWKVRFLAKSILSSGGVGVGRCRPAKKVDRLLALKCLFVKRPEFAWSHPFSLLLQAIPAVMTAKDLHKSIVRLLTAKAKDPLISQSMERVKVLPVFADPSSGTWKATIQFAKPIDYDTFYKKSNSTDGIALFCSEKLAWITEEIASTEADLKEAVAESNVYPCDASKKNEMVAKKAYKTAKLGLRILSKDKCRAGHVSCIRGFGNLRDVRPKSYATLCISAKLIVEDQTGELAMNIGIKAQEEKLVQRLGSVLGSSDVSQEVQSLSAFDALQALRNGEAEKTKCPICLGPLGCSGGKLKLTRCGHLFCISCLDEFQQTAQGRMLHLPYQGQLTAPCPSCRKPVAFAEVVRVDPKRTADQEASDKRRVEAKSLVQDASQMLEKSNGQLDPHLWEALYLAIDLPPGADKSVHGTFTAIPGQFLAHLRHATGMPVCCTPNEGVESFELPSKIRALLSDLPREERSVVFASSKQTVKHLLALLEIKHIGCRGLFTGQSEAKSESAVQDWKSNDNISVLVVQAGAAACGLTLTAASKMFILEPFIKHEEEQQAYARLHRYGQEKEVVCKIYYTPVSVESRLLEWRKRATGQAATEEMIVYAPLRTDATDEGAETADQNQTRFLLGLKDDGGGTEESSDTDLD